MFRHNCTAIFRLTFEQVECTIDNAFNLRNLVLQVSRKLKALSIVHSIYLMISLKMALQLARNM